MSAELALILTVVELERDSKCFKAFLGVIYRAHVEAENSMTAVIRYQKGLLPPIIMTINSVRFSVECTCYR